MIMIIDYCLTGHSLKRLLLMIYSIMNFCTQKSIL